MADKVIRLLLIEEFFEDSPMSLKAFSDEYYESVWKLADKETA